MVILQGHSGRNQGLDGLRPAFENQAPFAGNGIGQGNTNQFSGQVSQARPAQPQQSPQQQTIRQFPQSTFAQQPQQFDQSIPAQPPQPARDAKIQQFAQAPNLGSAVNSQQFSQTQQQFSSQPQQVHPAQSHPEKFINQLSPEEKQQFLKQFE